ncbi:purine-nucleoside phosphorylase [Burkholderia ubonensis]|uniref:purine-nucleoside phosphorylase n=1 Tax=Burkholderia ubonensis TaxID=101571 RepID=UPI00075C0B55|nr:purine nucleoside permease [Burkholderia ubonensis]KVG32131.1 purine nucleoside permease [Burkholderia ubonensis]KVP36884.1 purine nucleoside permease [Burkholderia ubonensis]KVQ82399.1 purine nucleoside permease [Burkholderia ubonensis]KVR11895.1 purine nucleoside permease [Burkholderia ubonensis]KWD35606.1 purine nucleoside permease [Burkholderia ubonensis]
MIKKRMLRLLAVLALAGTFATAAHAAGDGARRPRPVKVLIVTMFGPEGNAWLDRLGPLQRIAVPGLSPDYPAVSCTRDDVCVLTTGMGHANAAASMAALVYSRRFDLRRTYFLVTGIAGIDPAQGTLGSAAWARYLVDFGIQWELDAREIPAGWRSGYLGINTKSENDKPPLDYRTEVFQLNEALLQKALALSRGVTLHDSKEAAAYRAKYPAAPANQRPTVIQCDTLAGDTWFSGTKLGERASEWTRLLTDGKGVYCTTQQEDNATFEVIKRAAAAGLADPQRVAVLRSGSDFDRPPPGGSDVDNLLDYQNQGGFLPALDNLYLAGSPLVNAIVKDWAHWQHGVPAE